MIAGKVMCFLNEEDTPEVDEPTLIELTDVEQKHIEISFDLNDRRVYVQFRMSDLVREIKEYGE